MLERRSGQVYDAAFTAEPGKTSGGGTQTNPGANSGHPDRATFQPEPVS
jgi:hypothetical protein